MGGERSKPYRIISAFVVPLGGLPSAFRFLESWVSLFPSFAGDFSFLVLAALGASGDYGGW